MAGAAIVALGPVVDSDADAPARLPRAAIRVDVGSQPLTRPLPPGFIGLSIEFPSSIAYSGPDPAHPNPVYLQLVRNLTPGQSPVIRFGGDTTDWTWWPTPGVAKPGGIKYLLTRHWLAVTSATARALDARLIVGINFEADSRRIAGNEARQLLRGIGRRYIAGFELGNEPEVYGRLGWYSTPAKVPVPGRPSSYDFQSFLGDYGRVASALPRGVPLVGPASGASPWLAGLGRYLAANRRLRIATFHRYPLHRCFTARSAPDYPSITNLLSPVASSGPATSLASSVAAAHARDVALRADELNSVSCGGAHGVSDTFASSLWSLDTLFNLDRVGLDGVNIHTFRTGVYAPFAFEHTSTGWRATVRPMYYGLLLFARAAPPGSRILPSVRQGPSSLRIWSTRASDGRVRVLVLNDSRRHLIQVAVAAPVPAQAATLERLRAPRVTSGSGVTLAGQSYGAYSPTGRLQGARETATVMPVQRRYLIRVPTASAALLTLNGH